VNLKAVLERLEDAKLTLKPSKCFFGVEKIEFLGYVVEAGEIRPGHEKTRAIDEYPIPTDVHAVRRFLGLTGFFRRFVKHYSVVAEPLSRLTRKDQPFIWGEEQLVAFNQLRTSLTSETVQMMFSRDAAVTELHADASAAGLGAILLQSVLPRDPLRVVYYASRKTSEAETRYHSSKLELLCVVWAMYKLRQFLLGLKFVVFTDCQALIYLNQYKGTNGQVARWHDLLQDYDFEVKYRPGARMAHVDALSRASVEADGAVLDDILADQFSVCVSLTETERVAMCQAADEEVKDIKRLVLQSTSPSKEDDHFVVEKGLLYRKFKDKLLFVMPKSMRKSLVVTAHDLSGHPALDRTVANIVQDFWFSGMRRYVRLHINVCFECLLTKRPRGKMPGYLHPIPIGKRPFETVYVDHVGPFITTKAGKRYILVMIDNLTKYVSLFAVKSTTAEELIDCMKSFIGGFGLPGRLVTDRGSCYTSGAFERFCVEQGIQLVLTSSRHPQANGQVERTHSVVMSTLMTLNIQPNAWDESLTEVQRILNNSETKVSAKTPFEMLHGYRPRFKQGALRELSTTVNEWLPPEDLRREVLPSM